MPVLTVTSDRVTSDRVSARKARRGVTLAEGILYLTISFSVITFSAQTLVQERDKQEEALVAGDLRQHLASAQGYVAARYDRILGELYAGTAPGDPLALDLGLDDVVETGYLPAVYVNNEGALDKVYGQDFTILARAVLRSEALATPPGGRTPTAMRNAVETAGGGAIRPELTDRIYDDDDPANINDEIDLEVLLITTGGDPAGVNRGNRIVTSTRMPSAGFVRLIDEGNPNDGIEAVGPYGAWTLDVTPFQDAGLLDESGAGYFASLVALSNFGAVSADPADVSDKVEAEQTMSRCAGLPAGSETHEECLSGNGLYDAIVFNAWDKDGDGAVDQFPGLAGVGAIEMSDEPGASGEITGVRGIAMRGAQAAISGVAALRTAEDGLDLRGPDGEPAGISGIGRLEMAEGRIDSLLGISCIAGGAQTVLANGIAIDCPDTRLSGTLITAGAATIGGALAVKGAAEIDGAATIGGAAKIGGALDVAGDAALAGNVTVGAPNTAATAGGNLTATGALAASAAEIGGTLSAGETRVSALSVGGTRADQAILMSSRIMEFNGGALYVAKPACGDGFKADVVAMPISFEAKEDTGSAYDRGTKVPDDWYKNKDKEWPMERHENEKWPGHLIGVETDIDDTGGEWKVNLTIKRRAWFNEISTSTEDNPNGARMMIQTLCSKDTGA